MGLKELLTKELTRKIACVVLLVIIAALSMTVVSKIATAPETYSSTIQSIDEKKAAVTGATATAAAMSAGLAAIPGDATTPIANQIMQLSSYLLIVVCALVLEKSLLTVMGFLSFNILVPISCALLGVYTFVKKRNLKILAIKFIVFALVIVMIIPFSLMVSDMIYEANQGTVEQVTSMTETDVIEEPTGEDQTWVDKMINKVKEGASDVGEKAKQILNSFIDAIALFIITYCALPIIIIFIVIWFINFLFDLKAPTPDLKKMASKINKKREKKEEQGKELTEVSSKM